MINIVIGPFRIIKNFPLVLGSSPFNCSPLIIPSSSKLSLICGVIIVYSIFKKL